MCIRDRINASAGYGEDVLKQLDKLKESSAGKGWNKKGIEQLEQAFRPSIEQTRKEKDERGIEEIKRVQQNQNELDANIEQKYSGLTENQKKWGNRIASIGSVLPSALNVYKRQVYHSRKIVNMVNFIKEDICCFVFCQSFFDICVKFCTIR